MGIAATLGTQATVESVILKHQDAIEQPLVASDRAPFLELDQRNMFEVPQRH
jgi:hypothetical protein